MNQNFEVNTDFFELRPQMDGNWPRNPHKRKKFLATRMPSAIMNARERCLSARMRRFLQKMGVDKAGGWRYAIGSREDEIGKLVGLIRKSPLLVEGFARTGKLKVEPLR